MSRLGAQLLILVPLVGFFLMRETRLTPASLWEDRWTDFLSMNGQRSEQPSAVTVVEISPDTQTNHPWPWSPLDFALFFRSANAFRPEVVATDEILRWDRTKYPPAEQQKISQYEKILREQLLESGKVLLAAKLGIPDDPDVIPPLEEVRPIRRVSGDTRLIPDFTALEAQSSDDYRLSSTMGFTNLPSGAASYHKVPLVLRYRGQVVPSFALQAVLLLEQLTPEDVEVVVGEVVRLNDRVEIPIDATGRMRVDFGVPRARCDFSDLLLSAEQAGLNHQTVIPRELLSNRLLLLTRTDPEARTLPLAGRKGSAGELFAAAVATIHSRAFIYKAPVWVEWTIIGLATLVGFLMPRWRRGRVAFVLVLSALAYVLVSLGVFGKYLIALPGLLTGGVLLFLLLYRLVLPQPPKKAY